MKTTLRRNGRVEATFVARHYVGGAEVAKILARFHANGYGYSVGDKLTRGQVERLVRDLLAEWGNDAFESQSWTADLFPGELADLHRWAVGEVSRLFPEFVDCELRRLAAEYAT